MGGDDLTMHDEVISSGEVLYFGVKKEGRIGCPIGGGVCNKTDLCRYLGFKSVCNLQRAEFRLVA